MRDGEESNNWKYKFTNSVKIKHNHDEHGMHWSHCVVLSLDVGENMSNTISEFEYWATNC